MRILLSALLAIIISNPLYALTKIKLTNGEWPPYLSEHLVDNGFVSAVVREAFKAVDIDVIYGYFPWKRSYYYAKKGMNNNGQLWHGSVVWCYSEERAKFFYYSDPVIVEESILYHLKSNPIQWNNIKDLQGLTIGGTSHTIYPLFEEAQKNNILKLQRAGNYGTLFNRLLAGRIDAIPNTKGVSRYYLYTHYTQEVRDRVTFSPNVFETRVYHLILNKFIPENKKNIKLFNQGMRIIKSDGTYKRLLLQLENGYFYKEN